jgi:hypothetical protein
MDCTKMEQKIKARCSGCRHFRPATSHGEYSECDAFGNMCINVHTLGENIECPSYQS